MKSSLYQNRLDKFGAKIYIQLIDEWTQTIDGERFLHLDKEYETVKTVNKVRTKYPGRLLFCTLLDFLNAAPSLKDFFWMEPFFVPENVCAKLLNVWRFP